MQDLNLLALAGARMVGQTTKARVRLSGIRQSFAGDGNRTHDILRARQSL